MPKANYELIKRLLADGWNGEEFNGDKQICASLLLCSYTMVAIDYDWLRDEFVGDFAFTWGQLHSHVTEEFVRICLLEMFHENR